MLTPKYCTRRQMNQCNCPKEVEWRPIRFNPLMRVMERIRFVPTSQTIVPDHLYEDGICEQKVVLYYDTSITPKELHEALQESGLSWESIDYEKKTVWAGSVFKILHKKGHWILYAPCMYCYIDIASQTDDVALLNRCVIQSFL